MATDLAEFLGGALGVSLLLHVPLACGMAITGMVTLAILTLDKRGFRPLEMVIAALVGIIGLSYLYELGIARLDWQAALFHALVPQLRDYCPALPISASRTIRSFPHSASAPRSHSWSR